MLEKFRNIIEYTLSHPIMRDMYGARKESLMMIRELPMRLYDEIERKTD